MVRLVVFITAFAATTLCLAVVASGAPQPILKLALQRGDMPAGTERAPFGQPDAHVMGRDALAPFGIRGLQGVGYGYAVPAGGTVSIPSLGAIDKQWRLEGDVFRAPDQNGAKRLFALGKAAGIGFFSDFPQPTQNLALPRFGDEQVGHVATNSDGVHVLVLVRTGSIVWELMVLPIPRQFKATKAQTVSVLQTYAAKQQRRAGNG